MIVCLFTAAGRQTAAQRSDTATQPPAAEVQPEYVVDTLRLTGVTIFDPAILARGLQTRSGRPFSEEALEEDIVLLLERYADAGYPVAEVRVGAIRITDRERLAVVLNVNEHAAARLGRIILRGATRTDASFVEEIIGIRSGASLQALDVQHVRRRLQESGYFSEVGPPQLRLLPDSSIALLIPVEERPPGSFNIALGYQPPSGDEAGRFVGSGRLALNNLFGRGRQAELQLRQLPEQASRLFVEVRAPLVFGLPIGAEASFRGIQQDSSYNETNYRLGATWSATSNLTAILFARRQATRPGQAGIRVFDGTQAIPRSGGWFAGIGARYVRVDDVINPRRGFVAEISFEGGRDERLFRQVTAEGDTARVKESVRQERVEGGARVFLPALGPTQVLVVGADAALVVSPTYDRSDFFRLGGATSLRGYNEDRFLGRFIGRLFAEYRYLLDQRSYTYIFTDVGFLDRPDIPGPLDDAREVLPGYGIGIQFDTQIGLADVSLAANPKDPLGIRVHAGLSLGL